MRIATALLLAAFAACAAQAGDIYRWKDANGAWHYSDLPVAGAERVAASRRGNEGAAPPAAPVPSTTAGITPATAAAQEKDATRKVREDVSAAKATRCKQAQADYEQTISARRLYRAGANGEPVYLTDAEIEAARVSARTNMDYYCGK